MEPAGQREQAPTEPEAEASRRRALLVIKPVAVRDVGGDPGPYIARRLGESGIECTVERTQPDQSVFDLVRTACQSHAPPDLVIAAGGDGTHGPRSEEHTSELQSR